MFQGGHFGMIAPIGGVVADADDLIVACDDGADHGVGFDQALTASGFGECQAHPSRILRVGHFDPLR